MTSAAQINKNQLFALRRQSYAQAQQARQSLDADVDAFLAAGGRIQVVPPRFTNVPLIPKGTQPYPSLPRTNPDDELMSLFAVAEFAGMRTLDIEVLIAAGRGPVVAQRKKTKADRTLLRFFRRDVNRWLAGRIGAA